MGCLLAEGIPPEYMSAYIGGRTLDEIAHMEDRGDLLADRDAAVSFRLHRGLPRVGPGSVRMALSTLRRPLRHPGATLAAGWLPQGFVSTRPIAEVVETFVAGDWPDHRRGLSRSVGQPRRSSPPTI